MESSYVTTPSAFNSEVQSDNGGSVDSNVTQAVHGLGLEGRSEHDFNTISGVSLEGSLIDGTVSVIPAIERVIGAIRVLTADAVEKARSGHPGMPLGMAPTAAVLWMRHLRINPCNPDWVNRDRFILSAGHGSMLQYALMYLFGFDSVTIEDLKTFRQLGSRACGHPENTITHGIEVSTGPLGQGISNAVGMALAESHLGAVYNREYAPSVMDHYTYCIAGDGCLMEGVASEACSLAGHWGLGKLIVFWDDNEISIEGSTEIAFTEDVVTRYEAYGWQVLWVKDGDTDISSIDAAIMEAKACQDRPTLIRVTTTIGFGAPTKAGTAKIHGSCLGADEIQGLREKLHWDDAPFILPSDVLGLAAAVRAAGEDHERSWRQGVDDYFRIHPTLGNQFESLVLQKQLPTGWADSLKPLSGKEMSETPRSTRQLSHQALNALAGKLPQLFGGSADLGPSNLTELVDGGDYQRGTRSGRNLHFGVREHGMAAIAVGAALHHSGLIPFCATFFVFTDYCRAAMRMAAFSRAGVVFVLTHDSVLLGEDGPTHQPIEHLAALRAMPGVFTMRPADAVETATCYDIAIRRRDAPTALVLSRQKYRCERGSALGTRRGAYVFSDTEPKKDASREASSEASPEAAPEVILIATGSEVAICESAARVLRAEGRAVRVVSMPCMELFRRQPCQYRRSVLPRSVPMSKRLVVEAGSSFGWHEYARNFHTVDEFGASGSQSDVANLFKLTVRDVAERVRHVLDKDSDLDYDE